jgi:hypothetical protein
VLRAAKCCHNSEKFPLAQQPKAGQGRLILKICRSHTTTHHKQQDSSGLGIGPSQRSLLDNTQRSQERETSLHLVGFELAIPANDRPQTLALDRSATGIGLAFQRAAVILMTTVRTTNFVPLLNLGSYVSPSPQHGASSGCGWSNGLQMWRVAAKTFNNQSRTADKGWPSSLEVGGGANNSSP